ncbi:GNAT family N-acetyltransferase [Polaribacter sargassicola]|uniref:GNAT family N-acetyltransferase n=1 Tax=Polaribacter sargassicola TaxID=2836891 RepID=UPI001F3EC894|nr:GNAT family N-acetyltransferase [Polaribacter sp. DS7-9]MCG1036307.1 GNAT family N-acetyltransferase [Polaribacter sp. DS7-9]
MELKLAESKSELQQILDLQHANHYDNVSEELKKVDGFVTVKHNLDLLTKMNNEAKHIIAVDNGKVIAYALTMLKDYKDLIPVLVPMFTVFESINYKNTKLSNINYYVMGQVCVADTHRGKGIFKALYEKHKDVYASKFDLLLTEVSSSNHRSMRAHEKVGFKTINTFKDDTDEWNILSWNWE